MGAREVEMGARAVEKMGEGLETGARKVEKMGEESRKNGRGK
jgi:hypothetical protein